MLCIPNAKQRSYGKSMSMKRYINIALPCKFCQILVNKARIHLFRGCHALPFNPFEEYACRIFVKIQYGWRGLHGLPTQDKVCISVGDG